MHLYGRNVSNQQTAKKRHWKSKLESHLTKYALWAQVCLSGPRIWLLLSSTPSLVARRNWGVSGLSEKDSINDFHLRPWDVFWTEFSSPEGCANVNTIYFKIEIKYSPCSVCIILNKPHIVRATVQHLDDCRNAVSNSALNFSKQGTNFGKHRTGKNVLSSLPEVLQRPNVAPRYFFHQTLP